MYNPKKLSEKESKTKINILKQTLNSSSPSIIYDKSMMSGGKPYLINACNLFIVNKKNEIKN